MNLFIDGLIFARQQWGGISRMWEAYLDRLPQYVRDIRLLVPARHRNPSLTKILEQNATGCENRCKIIKDYFYWPVRFFERIPVRSRILDLLYVDGNVDIFHSTFHSTLPGNKTRKLVTIHDMIPELFQVKTGNPWIELEILKKKETLQRADTIISVSHHTKKDLLEIYPWLPEEKIRVIHHGLFREDRSIPAGSFEETVKRLPVTGNREIRPGGYYLYVGNRDGYKNFQLLIDLLTQSSASKDVLFVCVGGEDPAPLLPLLEEKKIKHNFIFTGYADDGELSMLYRNATALVFPSKYEGFGLPVLEAMVNECPVVCSNVSSLPEVGGDAATYFDPDSVDSLQEALDSISKTNRDTLIKKGLENTKRFSWDRSTEKLVEIYHSLL